ncbi:LmbU family transcriptional regulator [Streptomyces puniciscabiei]
MGHTCLRAEKVATEIKGPILGRLDRPSLNPCCGARAGLDRRTLPWKRLAAAEGPDDHRELWSRADHAGRARRLPPRVQVKSVSEKCPLSERELSLQTATGENVAKPAPLVPLMARSNSHLKVVSPADANVSNIVVPRTGLNLPPRLPFEKWMNIGYQLSTIHTSSAWCLGDWLVYGEGAFEGRYRKAVERCSLHYQTLRNYAWVARRFPLSRRRDTLSFGHHAEVARLSDAEQDYWLSKAESLSWSRNRLRREVRASLNQRDECDRADADTEPEDGSPQDDEADAGLRLELSASESALWTAAANRAGLSVSAWAVRELNAAARGIGPA